MHDFETLCDAWASVLFYPEHNYSELVAHLREISIVAAPDAVENVDIFTEHIDGKSLSELEERYIKTFDLNPLCSLDTGWQLFGEEYHRGLYMVRVREEMRRFDLPESTELPDHLTNALRVLGRMPEDDAISFAVSCLIPAVNKILRAVKNGDIYRPLVQAIADALEARYGQYVKEFEEAAAQAEAAVLLHENSQDYSGVFAQKEADHE